MTCGCAVAVSAGNSGGRSCGFRCCAGVNSADERLRTWVVVVLDWPPPRDSDEPPSPNDTHPSRVGRECNHFEALRKPCKNHIREGAMHSCVKRKTLLVQPHGRHVIVGLLLRVGGDRHLRPPLFSLPASPTNWNSPEMITGIKRIRAIAMKSLHWLRVRSHG